ncbi:MAG: hypothetical protein CMJ58_25740 [Planctomycetaceae bacterium]|nr:hypothetical protein [Planctomycetaceae bacterium]
MATDVLSGIQGEGGFGGESGGDKTTAQLTGEYEAHVGQATAWKKQLLAAAAGLFEDQTSGAERWTTCSSSDRGRASSTKRSTCTTTPTAGRPRCDWLRTFGFKRMNDLARPSATAPGRPSTPSETEGEQRFATGTLNDKSREWI